jgi:hypothetical protein
VNSSNSLKTISKSKRILLMNSKSKNKLGKIRSRIIYEELKNLKPAGKLPKKPKLSSKN